MEVRKRTGLGNKIGFVAPVRRNEAPDRCTAASNVN